MHNRKKSAYLFGGESTEGMETSLVVNNTELVWAVHRLRAVNHFKKLGQLVNNTVRRHRLEIPPLACYDTRPLL